MSIEAVEHHHHALLQQIAIDVAVIKNDIEALKESKIVAYTNEKEISKMRSQLALMRWLGGVLGGGLIGMFIKLLSVKMF